MLDVTLVSASIYAKTLRDCGTAVWKEQRMVSGFLSLFSNDIGIDLGTANTLIYAKDRGIVLRAVGEGIN